MVDIQFKDMPVEGRSRIKVRCSGSAFHTHTIDLSYCGGSRTAIEKNHVVAYMVECYGWKYDPSNNYLYHPDTVRERESQGVIYGLPDSIRADYGGGLKRYLDRQREIAGIPPLIHQYGGTSTNGGNSQLRVPNGSTLTCKKYSLQVKRYNSNNGG